MNKAIIAAAAILGASLVISVLLFIRHEDAVRLQEQRRIACEDDKRAFDACLSWPATAGNPTIYQSCKSSWQPQIDKDCKKEMEH